MTIETAPSPTVDKIRQQARRLLLAIPEEHFHMRSVYERAECGTACCFAGWMGVDDWFRRHTPIMRDLSGHRSSLFMKLGEMLGIGLKDANNLFAAEMATTVKAHAVTKAEVLWNLDQIITGKPTRPYAATRYQSPYQFGPFAADVEYDSAKHAGGWPNYVDVSRVYDSSFVEALQALLPAAPATN